MLMRNSSPDNSPPEIYPVEEETGGISGRWVILGILVLAVAATAFEWNYMRMHRAPFIPLREAIAANPNYADAYYNLGRVAELRGHDENALTHYAEAAHRAQMERPIDAADTSDAMLELDI